MGGLWLQILGFCCCSSAPACLLGAGWQPEQGKKGKKLGKKQGSNCTKYLQNTESRLQNTEYKETEQHAHNCTKFGFKITVIFTEFGPKITEYRFKNKEYSETGQHADNSTKYIQKFRLKYTKYRIYKNRVVGSKLNRRVYSTIIQPLLFCKKLETNWIQV